MSKYLEATVINIEFDENDEKVVHIYGDSYYSCDGISSPYRFTEYCFGYIPLKEVVEKGMPDGDWYSELKQYIEDCTEEQLNTIYEHYDNGKMPQIIDDLTMDTPLGCYIIMPQSESLILCKHYDNVEGWCKLSIDWSNPMPSPKYCNEKCKNYKIMSHYSHKKR